MMVKTFSGKRVQLDRRVLNPSISSAMKTTGKRRGTPAARMITRKHCAGSSSEAASGKIAATSETPLTVEGGMGETSKAAAGRMSTLLDTSSSLVGRSESLEFRHRSTTERYQVRKRWAQWSHFSPVRDQFRSKGLCRALRTGTCQAFHRRMRKSSENSFKSGEAEKSAAGFCLKTGTLDGATCEDL